MSAKDISLFNFEDEPPVNIDKMVDPLSVASTSNKKAIKPTNTPPDIWIRVATILKERINETAYNQWLRPLKAAIDGDKLVLTAINASFSNYIKAHYLTDIQSILDDFGVGLTATIDVMVITPINTHRSADKKNAKDKNISLCIEDSEPIESRFTFENFVKGKPNQLAYNACLQIAKKVGQQDNNITNNLLFIYGSSGLGKTHLMQAVAHRYQKAGVSYGYFTKDKFFKVAINALRGKDQKTNEVLKKIIKADLLIIDDVHLINNQDAPKVSRLLLSLFTEFTKNNKLLILASDRPPSQMEKFDEHFLSRFDSGLSVAIEPPDIELRMQILQKKAAVLGVDIPKECALFISQNVPSDVRRLEGALSQVHAMAMLTGQEVDLFLVKKALKDRIEARARATSSENIRDVVAEYYSVSVKDMMGKKRSRDIVRPRQMAMALIRELTRDSFPEIGQVFGGRDHSTVMHACEKIQELRQTDVSVEKDYQALMATLEFN